MRRLRPVALAAWLARGAKWPRRTVAAALFSCDFAVIARNARIFWTGIVLRRPAPAVAPAFGGLLAAPATPLARATGNARAATDGLPSPR